MKNLLTAIAFLLTLRCSQNVPEPDALVPGGLRCEYAINPINVESKTPRLSWMVDSGARSQVQSAYRIMVASTKTLLLADTGDLWDSGKVPTDVTAHVSYGGRPMTSGERAWWKVMVWDKDGRTSGWSTPAYWEMGLLESGDWKGQWIGNPNSAAPYLRTEFFVPGEVESARVYVCGLGYYELYINGERIGDQVLDPGQTDYERRVFYVVHDVTASVKRGENAVGVILGNGWFNQTTVNHGKYGWTDCSYGEPRLLFQMEITARDGKKNVLVSGSGWKTADGPIIANNVYAGERYDARREIPGWCAAGFDDSAWRPATVMESPGGRLVSQKIPPIKRIETIRPVSVTEPEPGTFVYDMGQNFAGWARLSVEAERGTTIHLRFAEEIFENGMIDPASTGVFALNLVQADTFTCRGGGPETWEPRFTYHGFRYVEMTGYAGTPTLDNLEGVVVHTALEKAGEFACSDPMLNRIHETALWTQRSNLHSIPTDCPAREKCGWLGDAHITAEMVIYNWDAPLFWTKYVRDIETSRRGGVPDNIAPGRRHGGKAADWATAFIQIPWYLYLYYGDIEPAREHYDGMKYLMDYYAQKSKDFILYDGLGDWCPPGSVRPVETPVELTSTAFYYYDAGIMKTFAGILGKSDDERHYYILAKKIKAAFIRQFYDSGQRSYGSQTADALALYLGLFPDGDEAAVSASLNQNVIGKHHGHHSTGIFGSRHVYWALGRAGYGETVLNMLRQTTYPSIGYLLSIGATTLWESWDRDESAGAHGPRSHNHPMQGGFDAWFYNGMGGINPDPDNPGFKHIIFRPQLYDDLEYARARYSSIRGLISSEWRKDSGQFIWDLSIPANTAATIYLPGASVEDMSEGGHPLTSCEGIQISGYEAPFTEVKVGSGTYHFAIQMR